MLNVIITLVVLLILKSVFKKRPEETFENDNDEPMPYEYDVDSEVREDSQAGRANGETRALQRADFSQEGRATTLSNDSLQQRYAAAMSSLQNTPFNSQANDSDNYFDQTPDIDDVTNVNMVDEIIEEFDLSKAVIYSEILKPKFNDVI